MAERLGAWAEVGAKTETVIAIKPHVGGALHTPEDAVWLLRQVDSRWIRCVYDYSHYALRGLELAASFRPLAPHTTFVHVKDARGDADQFQFLLPGDGDTDYVRYLRLLAEAGFHGDVVVEVSGQLHSLPSYDPTIAAKRCYAYLAAAFAKASVRRG
jgi:sugar phosphate isomerase/epimerase